MIIEGGVLLRLYIENMQWCIWVGEHQMGRQSTKDNAFVNVALSPEGRIPIAMGEALRYENHPDGKP